MKASIWHDRLTICQRTVALMRKLAPLEGYTATPVLGVRLLRSNRPLKTTPVLYEPGIVFVCQGRKKGLWGNKLYTYDPQHYLAVAVPIPFTMETEASVEEPLLAVYLTLDLPSVARIATQLDDLLGPPEQAPVSLISTPMDDHLSACVLRLLDVMGSPIEAAILAPGMLHEIYFRVLSGTQGPALRAALSDKGRVARICKVLQKIHGAYSESLAVNTLASEADMSVSTFHTHFKEVTHTSPLQYLKSLRLHKARLLMLRENMTAAAAVVHVGYESASQFSREFKRLFGLSPALEVARLRSAYAMPEIRGPNQWISSH
jgi:AraC-like DNA-binding protein